MEKNSKNNKVSKGKEFSKKKENKYYEHKPVREFKAKVSEDGRFWIFRDITTHVVPRGYITKIENNSKVKDVGENASKPIGISSEVEKRND